MAGAIIHVGRDTCYRIPVMEQAGFRVVRAEPLILPVQKAIANGGFSAIAFSCDPFDPGLVRATRQLTPAPLIGFESRVSLDKTPFDVVIRSLTSPSIWLTELDEVIEQFHRLRDESVRLRAANAQTRQESREVRIASRATRQESIRMRARLDAFLRGEDDKG